jgi:hypothetical protein
MGLSLVASMAAILVASLTPFQNVSIMFLGHIPIAQLNIQHQSVK